MGRGEFWWRTSLRAASSSASFAARWLDSASASSSAAACGVPSTARASTVNRGGMDRCEDAEETSESTADCCWSGYTARKGGNEIWLASLVTSNSDIQESKEQGSVRRTQCLVPRGVRLPGVTVGLRRDMHSAGHTAHTSTWYYVLL
eukprot:69207-Pyramimonas_sp.AAC.1